jgi:hypothetical protein
MTNSTLRKLVIIVSSVAALAGGVGIDTAYARGGGGFGGGHMGGGFGGGHMGGGFDGGHMGGGFAGGHMGGGFAGGHMGGEVGGGRLGGDGVAHMGGGSPLGAPAENHVGALAGVHLHPGATGLRYHHHSRWLGDYAWGPRCDYATDYVMVDPTCRPPY